MFSKLSQQISTYLNKSQHISNKSGISLIILAMIILVLLGFAALAIDFAYVYYVKNELQVAADAAALAGAAKLTGAIDSGGTPPPEELARKEAWKFACKNKAAGSNVWLSTNNPTNCDNPPDVDHLNKSNNVNGDIIVGHWTPNNSGINCNWETLSNGYFCPANGNTGLAINAIKIVPKRTGATPGMPPVGVFFGRIFNILGINVKAEAIAARVLPGVLPGVLPYAGISICLKTCDLNASDENPISLDLREQEEDSPFGLAWTQFDQSSSIGTQSCVDENCQLDNDCGTDQQKRVAAIIWRLIHLPDVCGQSITTKNGVTDVLDDLGCAFRSLTHDASNKVIEDNIVKKWRVIVPVQEKCPAGKEPGPWPVVGHAMIEIKEVSDTGQLKGIQITNIQCMSCQDIYQLNIGMLKLVN